MKTMQSTFGVLQVFRLTFAPYFKAPAGEKFPVRDCSLRLVREEKRRCAFTVFLLVCFQLGLLALFGPLALLFLFAFINGGKRVSAIVDVALPNAQRFTVRFDPREWRTMRKFTF